MRAPIAIAVALSVLAAAAGSASAQSSMGPVKVPISAQNGSGESGTATLTDTSAGLKVDMAIKGAPEDAQPEHIHVGSCDKLGAVKYPLKNLVNGKSSTTVPGVKLADVQTGGFAINVHKSTSDLKDYVACGNIPKMGAM